MAAIKNIDIRKGMVIVRDDGLCLCLDRDLNTPGNWRAILQIKLKNLKTGSITIERLHPDNKSELAYLDTRDMQYSYREGENLIFMDTESYEQLPLSADMVENIGFLRENDLCKVTTYEGKALSVELQPTVEMRVTETDPGMKGATAAAQYKPATVETGAKVTVPPFINIGDMIKIDTATGEYLARVTTK